METMALWLIVAYMGKPVEIHKMDAKPIECAIVGTEIVKHSKEPVRVHCIPRRQPL